MMFRAVGLLMVVLCCGCAANIPQPMVIERDGIDAIVLTDDHKVSYIKQQGHIDRICAAVEADAVATDESGFSLGLSALGKSERIGEHSGRGELSLGGRDPLVLIAREFLYRACEMTNNLNSNEEKTIQVYQMFLDTLEKIAETHPAYGTAPAAADEPEQKQRKKAKKKKNKWDDDDKDDDDDNDNDKDDDDEDKDDK
ncbi:MAG: hypothetical protein AB1413_10790 [Thermodesulfobacteriota bacterium]